MTSWTPELPQGDVLVVGSYAPLPGHASEVTAAAVGRAWDAGFEVVVASPRHGAAQRTIRLDGPEAAERLATLRRQHGTRRLVLCAEVGMPFPRGRRRSPTLAAWAQGMDGFDHVTVVLPGDLGLSAEGLAPLWAHVDTVEFDGAAGADPAGVAAAVGLDPARLVDVRPAASPVTATPAADVHPEVGILRRALAVRMAAQAAGGRPEGVTVYGPPEVLPRERPRQMVGIGARAVLGPAAPVVRRQVARAVRLARSRGH